MRSTMDAVSAIGVVVPATPPPLRALTLPQPPLMAAPTPPPPPWLRAAPPPLPPSRSYSKLTLLRHAPSRPPPPPPPSPQPPPPPDWSALSYDSCVRSVPRDARFFAVVNGREQQQNGLGVVSDAAFYAKALGRVLIEPQMHGAQLTRPLLDRCPLSSPPISPQARAWAIRGARSVTASGSARGGT